MMKMRHINRISPAAGNGPAPFAGGNILPAAMAPRAVLVTEYCPS
jgi:hypothetical protein